MVGATEYDPAPLRHMAQTKQRAFWTYPAFHDLVCVLLLLALTLLSRPFVETGVADDWYYAISANSIVQTGHIVYNGWSSAMLGWMLYWGALFIRIFGYSYFSARLSIVVLSLLLTVLLRRTFVRCGISQWNSTIGTLSLVLFPLFFPLAALFMSDVPGLLCMVLCLYCCLRAWQADSDRSAILWLLAAIVSNVVLGTARQICWLGLIVMVPSALFMLRHRRRVLLSVAVPYVVGLLAMWGLLHWFLAQPFSLPEKLIAHKVSAADWDRLINQLLHTLVELPLLMLPVWAAFFFGIPWRRRGVQLAAAAAVAAVLGFVAYTHHLRHLSSWLLPTMPMILCDAGAWSLMFGPGGRPVLLSQNVRLALTLCTAAVTIAFLLAIVTRRAPVQQRLAPGVPSLRILAGLFLPFLLAYCLLLQSRGMFSIVFDRYLLMVVIVLLVFSLRFYQDRISPTLPWISTALVAASALYSVSTVHDFFAVYRARLQAIQEVRAAGVPRS